MGMRGKFAAAVLDCGECSFGVGCQGVDGAGEGGAEDAALGDDGGDVLGRGDVEGGVFDACAVGGHLLAVGVGYFAGVALFYRDGAPFGCRHVYRVEGRGYVEGDAVLFGEDGDAVGADLVGGVAVGGDAVGTDDDGLDAALAHEVGGHVVAEDGGGDVVLEELPGGEACALKIGAGFVGEDVDVVTALDGGADDAESCAVAAGGEGSGVAVGEDGALFWQEVSAVGAEGFALLDVFVVEAVGEGYDLLFDLGDGRVGGCEFGVEVADLRDAPEEIDGGGARGGQVVADEGDFGGERGEGGGGGVLDAEGYAHGSGDADGGSAADDHVADDGGDLLVGGGENVGLFEGELGLVEEVDACGRPFESGNHVSLSLERISSRATATLCL
jgi:hypothetical protein